MKLLASICAAMLMSAHLAWTADDKAEQAAVAAAESWLKLVDEEKYDASWEQAAKLFKGAVSREKWREAIEGAGP